MTKRTVPAFLVTAALATALHEAYRLCPVPLVGLLAPVNESVWEHMKLLFWPFLLAGFWRNRGAEDPQRLWSGTLCALLGMPLGVLGIYYVLLGAFGVQALWIDLGLFYGALLLGFLLEDRLQRSGRLCWAAGVLVIAAGLYGAALILFTMAPPQLPLFLPPR